MSIDIEKMSDIIIYNLPFIFLFLFIIYLISDYKRYQKEKHKILNETNIKKHTPEKLILFRSKFAMTLKDVKKYYFYIFTFLIISLTFMLSLIIYASDNLSFYNFFDVLLKIIYNLDFPALDLALIIATLNLISFIAYSIMKNERLILTREHLTYQPMFKGKWTSNFGINWRLNWTDIKSITLGDGINISQLTIKTYHGKKRILIPINWFKLADDTSSNKSQPRSIFGKNNYNSKLESDFNGTYLSV